MTSHYRSLEQRIVDAEATVHDRIRAVRECLNSLEGKIRHERILNVMGELQQQGSQLDAAIAVLATLQDIQSNIQETLRDEDDETLEWRDG